MAKKSETVKEKTAGQPTKYKEEYNHSAFKMCLLGMNDKELARYFEISEATLHNWKKEYPKFLESIKEGRDDADGMVVAALYKKALGAKQTETIYKKGKVEMIVVKDLPPDAGAATMWLKNRQKDHWRDKQEHEVKLTMPVVIDWDGKESILPDSETKGSGKDSGS